MDEVEDLQCDIGILRDRLRALACDKAQLEVQSAQAADAVRFLEEDNQELRQQVRDLRCSLVSLEIEKEMLAITLPQVAAESD